MKHARTHAAPRETASRGWLRVTAAILAGILAAFLIVRFCLVEETGEGIFPFAAQTEASETGE